MPCNVIDKIINIAKFLEFKKETEDIAVPILLIELN